MIKKNNCTKKMQWSGQITVFKIRKMAKKMEKTLFFTYINGLFRILTANPGFSEEFRVFYMWDTLRYEFI